MTHSEHMDAFRKAVKGIAVHHIAKAMNAHCSGVNFQGCTRTHMAEVWANANADDAKTVLHERLRGKELDKIMDFARARQDQAKKDKIKRDELEKQLAERRAKHLKSVQEARDAMTRDCGRWKKIEQAMSTERGALGLYWAINTGSLKTLTEHVDSIELELPKHQEIV